MAEGEISKGAPKPPTLEEISRAILGLERCPDHGWIVLPLFGLRACCLLAVLQALERGELEEARDAGKAMMDGKENVRVLPRLKLGKK